MRRDRTATGKLAYDCGDFRIVCAGSVRGTWPERAPDLVPRVTVRDLTGPSMRLVRVCDTARPREATR